MPADRRRHRTKLDAAARDREIEFSGIDARADASGRSPGPRVARVPETHVHDTFSVDGIDTDRRERLLEVVLADRERVSAVSATARNGTVGIHHAPSLSRDDLRGTLESLGFVVDAGDAAFETRRASQFASARVAVAVLFGLMVATPYIAVLYPTRAEWLFYDPVTVQYLQSILDSQMATHFFVNLGALSGIAFLVACGPRIRRAIGAVADGRVTNDAAFVAGVTALFGYSTLAAFTGFEGTVHYDLVAYAVVAVTLWTHFGVDDPVTASTTADEPFSEAASEADDEPIAVTDGGR